MSGTAEHVSSETTSFAGLFALNTALRLNHDDALAIRAALREEGIGL